MKTNNSQDTVTALRLDEDLIEKDKATLNETLIIDPSTQTFNQIDKKLTKPEKQDTSLMVTAKKTIHSKNKFGTSKFDSSNKPSQSPFNGTEASHSIGA